MRHKIVTKKRSFWYSPVITVLLLLVLGWASVVAARATMKQREVMTLRDQARKEVTTLREKDHDLDEKIDLLSTDEGIDEELKAQYRVVKPHEQVVIIVPQDEAPEGHSGPNLSLWEQVRHFVGW